MHFKFQANVDVDDLSRIGGPSLVGHSSWLNPTVNKTFDGSSGKAA